MTVIRTFACLLAALCISGTQAVASEQDGLRKELENRYKAFVEACSSGNKDAFKGNMSSYSYATAINEAISAKREFNEKNIKRIGARLPDISNSQFVKMLRKGDTAALVYVKDLAEGEAGGKLQKEYVIIKFVRESGRWKFDKMAQQYGKDRLDEPKIVAGYAINGKVLPAPPLYPTPDYAGIISITSYGYRTAVIVNGVEQKAVEGRSSSGLVKGGLKAGRNRIEIKTEKKDEGTMFKPEISISKIPAAGKKGQSVFEFKPEGEIKRNYIMTFTVPDKDKSNP